jgi:hypothetical protein
MTETCALCGQEILNLGRSQVARQIVGWHVPRRGGGQNAVMRRHETGALAHIACVKYGSQEQGRLWDEKQEALWRDSRP